MSDSYLEIHLTQQPIELYKLLKIADLVSGGGEAKVVISEGYVLLNGEVEFQKRKKVYHNDIIEFNGETLQLIINEDLTEFSDEDLQISQETNSSMSVDQQPKNERKSKNEQTEQIKKAATVNNSAANRSKRKPISF